MSENEIRPQAFYRRYRPQTFDDLFGQEHIVTMLKNAARWDKLAHAYLFFGPRGVGKTTVARLIAKLANCETRQNDPKQKATGEPCNTCRSCLEITANRAIDVVEIDAASNRGIDEIRALKDNARLAPLAASHKVFIIDEVHQLTKDAFNALLKLLEEPPTHVLFILATTEFEKVPATITSRTQRFRFQRLPIEKIVEKLQSIVTLEKLKITPAAIELVAANGDGSARDAESLLDQVTVAKEMVEVEDVERMIGRVGWSKTSEFAGMILDKNVPAALARVHDLHNGGYNIVDANKELIHYFRRALSLKVDPTLEQVFKRDLTSGELVQLQTHAQRIDPTQHIPLIKGLIRAHSEMRYSPFPTVPLEVALMEFLC